MMMIIMKKLPTLTKELRVQYIDNKNIESALFISTLRSATCRQELMFNAASKID